MKSLCSINSHPTVLEHRIIKKEESINPDTSRHQILLIKSGVAQLTGMESNPIFAGSEKILFLQKGVSYTLTALEETVFYHYFIPDCKALCQQYLQFPEKRKGKPLSGEEFSLSFPPIIEEYIYHLDQIREVQGINLNIVELWIQELFYYLNISYSPETLQDFFYPLMEDKDLTIEFVYDNHTKVKTVREFAALSNRSLRTFEQKFKELMGMSAGEWLLQRRIHKVYTTVLTSDLPLNLVAEECGFDSLPQLTDFCKRHLGSPPSRIRKNA